MAFDIMGSSLDKLNFSNLKLPDLSSGISALQKAYPTKEQTIESLKNQILSQGTTGKWSGEGFGSPEANARNMAEILQGIGITDIRQFGQVDKYEPVTQIGYELNGKRVQNPRPGVYYEEVPVEYGDGGYYMTRRDLTPQEAAQVKPIYGVVTGYDEYNQPTYNVVDAKNVTTKDGQLVGVTGQTFGNKETGQVVPVTYGERQTDNAWGGTFAGSGNTGYRVEFAPDGTPYFYTTGASSRDSFFSDIAPILGLGLMFVPGMQGIGASIGSALAPAASAAVQAGIGNAIVQGAISEATGGDFLKGAALSGVGSLAGGLQPGLSEALGGGAVGDIASKALIGGTMSELSGGDFAQGALTSGVSAGIEQAKLSAADDYLSSLPGGHGPYSDAPVDMSDFDVAPPVVDTTFTPDYSLSVGAPVIPEIGAQGIQAPTINEIIETIIQPVDYALPTQNSEIGLQLPVIENLPELGGAQGITIPVVNVPEFVAPEVSFTPDYSLNVGGPVISEDVTQVVQAPVINDVIDVVGQPVDYSISAPSSGLEYVAPPVVETTFTPDYSLSTGTSVIPEMNAQGIQVPTINELVDVINQPINYELPVQSSGIGLQDQVITSLPELGGAQGILVPEFVLPEFIAPDTSFVPDYSFNVGSPVIPEMGAQGIQVPTINEVIDVVNQPVDYSLPIPDSGLGLVMPSAPNLESMGGGQGITVPVSGGTLTEAGVIPETYVPVLGDEQSFINQPAPNLEIVIPEQPAPQQNQPTEPKDISSNLAILDVLKAIVPTLVTEAIAEQVQNKQEEPAQTGFPILPVPSDWRSPEYNMAFTPSAPIDFRSQELLRGTQWEKPQITAPNQYALSNLINTLNMNSVPFVQQNYDFNPAPMAIPDILQQFNVAPTVGMTDIIGNLNSRPVSISDIIAGIQSGQNYSI